MLQILVLATLAGTVLAQSSAAAAGSTSGLAPLPQCAVSLLSPGITTILSSTASMSRQRTGGPRFMFEYRRQMFVSEPEL